MCFVWMARGSSIEKPITQPPNGSCDLIYDLPKQREEKP
jgi:coproporphyrinogen III oxidase-like Fe-S oxidoreductase